MAGPPVNTRTEMIAWLAIAALLFVLLSRLEAFEWFMDFSRDYEEYDIDEFALLFVVSGALLPVMLWRKNRTMRRHYESHRSKEAMLHRLAHVDSLTRLGNQLQFQEDMPAFVEKARAEGTQVWLIKINLDRFKQVNDLRGFPAGDVLLARVADRIASICEGEDTVSRTNNDEFAVLTRGSEAEARTLAQSLLGRLRDPFDFEAWQVEITASIGMAFWEDGQSSDDFVSHADQAMFWAKESGRNCLVEYDCSIGELTRKAAQMRADLIHAIETDVIKPYFQPIVCMESGRLIGFEALARWRHAENGFVSPETFIALAEDLGMIDQLTDNLFARCCREMADWPEGLRMSFNLSPVQLSDHAQAIAGPLPQRLLMRLDEAGVAPGRIDLEITERAVISDLDSARRVIAELRELGMRISLDDFGTGTSSLAVLAELPFDTIKIDRSFVTDIARRPDLAKIVRSVLFLAHAMEIDVTAEGIETAEELQFLRDHACEKGQGYLLGRPMQSDQLAPMLADGGAVWNLGQAETVKAVS